MNFSFAFPDVIVCIAAPQYRLGSYLNCKTFKNSLESIVGEITKESVDELDLRLEKLIKTSSVKPLKVHLHISRKEHTYQEHCLDLINDLMQERIETDVEYASYEKHEDLIFYFPSFLIRTLAQYNVK